MFKVLLVCFRMCKIPTPFLPSVGLNKINDLAALIMFCVIYAQCYLAQNRG